LVATINYGSHPIWALSTKILTRSQTFSLLKICPRLANHDELLGSHFSGRKKVFFFPHGGLSLGALKQTGKLIAPGDKKFLLAGTGETRGKQTAVCGRNYRGDKERFLLGRQSPPVFFKDEGVPPKSNFVGGPDNQLFQTNKEGVAGNGL